jgi:hypothetical protein
MRRSAGARRIVNLLPVKVQGIFPEAECKLDALNSNDFGGKRSLTAGQFLLWTEICGVRFSAQVAAAVSLKVTPKAAVPKDAAAICYANNMANSIANYLRSPMLGKRPKLIRKGTKAAAAEAALIAAEAKAAVNLAEIKRLAA